MNTKSFTIDGWKKGVNTAELNLPVSKSLMIRNLMMAALRDGGTWPATTPDMPEDIHRMASVLKLIDAAHRVRDMVVLDCGNAGSVARMAALYASLRGGEYLITGDTRLQERPAKELGALLTQGGIQIVWPGQQGFFPLRISSEGFTHNQFILDARQSSQHISALLLTGPYIEGGITVRLSENSVSQPYITMTVKLMRQAGFEIEERGSTFRVEPMKSPGDPSVVMPDWSSAAFFYEAVALAPVPATLLLKNLKFNGLQGDEMTATLFRQLGVQTEEGEDGLWIDNGGKSTSVVEADFTNHPDLFNAFATASVLLGKIVRFTGLQTLNYKESDRLDHQISGLQSLGYSLEYDGTTLITAATVPKAAISAKINPQGDHRIAMCFAMAGIKSKILLTDPQVVAKSFPGFYIELGKIANIW